jgi:DNA polymerase-3 subunit delta'
MTAPDPRANPHLVGHAAAEAALAEAVRAGRLHHAWLITGPAGIGKATLAFRFARRLLAGGAGDGLFLPPDHPVFHRVAAATHADLLTIEREWDDKKKRMRGEIVVNTARDIPEFLHLTPAEGGWRVVVVDGAEDLNPQAANAVLKMLEEPPRRTVLLLACAAPGRLLPTIRSRCRQLRLSPLTEAEVAGLLDLYLPDIEPARRDRLAAMAEGSPGRALLLAEGNGVALADLVAKALDQLPDMTVGRAHAVADAVGRDEAAFGVFMDLLRSALASAVRDAAAGRADPDQARLLGARPLADWAGVWQGLCHLQDETEAFHLDRRQAIVTGLGLLAGTAPRVS